MTTKHTPGPWRIADGLIKDRVVAGKNGLHIAQAASTGMPESEANARLISASPELLALLEKFLDEAEYLSECRVLTANDFVSARAAIAKARGK